MEAPTRFERVMEVLQTSALPLGDGAETVRRFNVGNEVPDRFWRVKEKFYKKNKND